MFKPSGRPALHSSSPKPFLVRREKHTSSQRTSLLLLLLLGPDESHTVFFKHATSAAIQQIFGIVIVPLQKTKTDMLLPGGNKAETQRSTSWERRRGFSGYTDWTGWTAFPTFYSQIGKQAHVLKLMARRRVMVTLSVHALAEHLLTATSYQVERGSMFITTRTHKRSFTCCTQSGFSSSSRFHFVMLHLCICVVSLL